MSHGQKVQIIPWEDNRGDHSWALVKDGVVLSKHVDQASAHAARERLLLEQVPPRLAVPTVGQRVRVDVSGDGPEATHNGKLGTVVSVATDSPTFSIGVDLDGEFGVFAYNPSELVLVERDA